MGDDKRAVKDGDKIKIHYIGKLEDDKVFDDTHGRDPIEFTVGQDMVLPAIAEAVVGMTVGETKSVQCPPDKGFGAYNEELVVKIPKDKLPPDAAKGAMLQDPESEAFWLITELDDESATLDGNHLLAGKTVQFEVEVLEIA